METTIEKVRKLDEDKRSIYFYYVKEIFPVRGMYPKILFSNTKECSCCGEVGWVPKDHRFLCIFCWVTNRYGEMEPEIPDNERGRIRGDVPRCPVGIEGRNFPPDGHVVYTVTYPVQDMDEAELRKLIPSMNS